MVKASTFVLALGMVPVSSFQNAAVTTTQRIRIGTTYTSTSQSICTQRRTSPLHMNFFKDLIGGAFENDPNLSRDKSEGQLEGPNDDDMNIFASNVEKTDVQKRWLESQSNAAAATAEKANTATATKSKFGGGFGAPMDPELLPNTKWKLALYLTGIPSFDPSNSLYGK